MKEVTPLTPLDCARMACDTMMRNTPRRICRHFHYHQGVFLSGVLKTWRLMCTELAEAEKELSLYDCDQLRAGAAFWQ